MFREMRRKDREIYNEEIIEILKNSDYGILSTVGQNGYPYGVPASFVFVNDSIYIHSASEGHKIDNILYNSRVSFCVVGQTCILPDKFSFKYESVILFGIVNEVFNDEKNIALLEMLKKYSPGYLDKGREYIKNSNKETRVIKISIEHCTGKAHR